MVKAYTLLLPMPGAMLRYPEPQYTVPFTIDGASITEPLMRTAIERAGAARGLLILPRGDELQIEAEATTSGDLVTVGLREARVAAADLPESILQYVVRTRDSVMLDDASAPSPFAADPYLAQHKARSVLCLPLIKQATLIGVLYLENNLTSHVFTPARIAVLKLLASQAAISLENTRLYGALRDREGKIRRLVDSNIIGIFIWHADGRILDANDAFLDMVGYTRDDRASGRVRWKELTPAEWCDADERARATLAATGTVQPYEKEFFRKDGRRLPVLAGGATFEARPDEGVAFVLDLTERKQAEESLRRSEESVRQAQAELAHVARVSTLGEMAASIAHEVNQPLSGVVINANACLRFLNHPQPNLDEVRDGLGAIARDGRRAGDVIAHPGARAPHANREGATGHQ